MLEREHLALKMGTARPHSWLKNLILTSVILQRALMAGPRYTSSFPVMSLVRLEELRQASVNTDLLQKRGGLGFNSGAAVENSLEASIGTKCANHTFVWH